jgi:hypothetical protein
VSAANVAGVRGLKRASSTASVSLTAANRLLTISSRFAGAKIRSATFISGVVNFWLTGSNGCAQANAEGIFLYGFTAFIVDGVKA